MNYYGKYVVFLFLGFILSLCSKRDKDVINDEDAMFVHVDIDEMQTIDIDLFADSVSYVKLEMNNECLIGDIRKVIFFENKFFIHETRTSTILVFDQSGKFLYKIGSRGNGPGEHVNLARFLLDEEKKMLMLYDDISRKMIYYSTDGKYVRQITQFSDGAVIRDIYNLPSGRFICYAPDYTANGDLYWGVWEVDSIGKPGKILIKHEIKYLIANTIESYFNQLPNGIVSLWLADADDIYHFSDADVHRYLSIKLNRKTVTDYPNTDDINLSIMRKSKVVEKENFLQIYWYWKNNDNRYDNYVTVFLKEDKKILSTKRINYRTNRMDAIFARNVDYNIPNQILQVISASSLENRLRDDAISQYRKDMLKSMFKDGEDNPILQIFHLK